VTSSILWGYFTLLWPVSFGENWYSKVYAGHSLRAFSVWDALRFRSYGLPFREKNALMPLTLGRAALCPPPRMWPFSSAKGSDPSPSLLFNDKSAPFFIWGALTALWNIFDAKDCFPPKK
ncbi:hypothetical protein, partial [uncultured Desulfovibrio sp.]|uniref:hypothetical protein n=1 Tax=uncultured Desulfovibrio sp. TaxID=167968 RepID=UPI00262467AF